MKVDLGIWDKLTWVVTILGLLAGIGFVAAWYFPLIQKNESMRTEISKLDLEIQQEEEEARKLKAAIDAIQRDPKTLERVARERLGYAKPGEIVIRYDEPVTNRPAPRQ